MPTLSRSAAGTFTSCTAVLVPACTAVAAAATGSISPVPGTARAAKARATTVPVAAAYRHRERRRVVLVACRRATLPHPAVILGESTSARLTRVARHPGPMLAMSPLPCRSGRSAASVGPCGRLMVRSGKPLLAPARTEGACVGGMAPGSFSDWQRCPGGAGSARNWHIWLSPPTTN